MLQDRGIERERELLRLLHHLCAPSRYHRVSNVCVGVCVCVGVHTAAVHYITISSIHPLKVYRIAKSHIHTCAFAYEM